MAGFLPPSAGRGSRRKARGDATRHATIAPLVPSASAVRAPSARIAVMNASRPLRRSRHNRWIGGVVGGLAEFFGLDPTLARIIYVLVSILSAAFPGILVYIILWILIPMED